MSIFSREKIMNSCPNAVKWLYFPCIFQNFCVGACPRTPLEKFRLGHIALSVPEKNPTFSQNLHGGTVYGLSSSIVYMQLWFLYSLAGIDLQGPDFFIFCALDRQHQIVSLLSFQYCSVTICISLNNSGPVL